MKNIQSMKRKTGIGFVIEDKKGNPIIYEENKAIVWEEKLGILRSYGLRAVFVDGIKTFMPDYRKKIGVEK